MRLIWGSGWLQILGTCSNLVPLAPQVDDPGQPQVSDPGTPKVGELGAPKAGSPLRPNGGEQGPMAGTPPAAAGGGSSHEVAPEPTDL